MNSDNKVIELRDVYEEQRQTWIADCQAQKSDHRAAQFIAALIMGLMLGALSIAMCGCTLNVKIEPLNFSADAIDGGGEPMGWEDRDALERKLNE